MAHVTCRTCRHDVQTTAGAGVGDDCPYCGSRMSVLRRGERVSRAVDTAEHRTAAYLRDLVRDAGWARVSTRA
jgi:Zn finger protein HypA/HybF involved in hydrogenase expression